jgi:glutaredoxin
MTHDERGAVRASGFCISFVIRHFSFVIFPSPRASLTLRRAVASFPPVPAPLKLYHKAHCSWCHKAREILDTRGYRYEAVEILENPAAFDEMIRLSGQSFVPVLVAGGKILADFGPEELEAFLQKHGIEP